MVCVFPNIIQSYQGITIFTSRNTHSCFLPRNFAMGYGAKTPSIFWRILLKNLVKYSLISRYLFGCQSFSKFALFV